MAKHAQGLQTASISSHMNGETNIFAMRPVGDGTGRTLIEAGIFPRRFAPSSVGAAVLTSVQAVSPQRKPRSRDPRKQPRGTASADKRLGHWGGGGWRFLLKDRLREKGLQKGDGHPSPQRQPDPRRPR